MSVTLLRAMKGTHDVTLSIDPSQQYEDPDRSDNEYTFSFTIDERPVEPMLRFLPGAARTSPDVPVPDTPYDIRLRVDNLGQTDASGLNLGLERWIEQVGWQRLDDQTVPWFPVEHHSLHFARFADVHDQTGTVSYRAVLSGSGVEIEHRTRFNITVAEVQAGSRGVSLPNSRSGRRRWLDEGGLLFTNVDNFTHEPSRQHWPWWACCSRRIGAANCRLSAR